MEQPLVIVTVRDGSIDVTKNDAAMGVQIQVRDYDTADDPESAEQDEAGESYNLRLFA